MTESQIQRIADWVKSQPSEAKTNREALVSSIRFHIAIQEAIAAVLAEDALPHSISLVEDIEDNPEGWRRRGLRLNADRKVEKRCPRCHSEFDGMFSQHECEA